MTEEELNNLEVLSKICEHSARKQLLKFAPILKKAIAELKSEPPSDDPTDEE